MKNFFALAVMWAFAVGVLSVSAQTGGTALTNQTNQSLAGLLPASDGAVSVNMQRLLSDAMPQILSGNQPLLADVLSHIDDVKSKTGIDLRQFEQIAVGISAKRGASRKFDFEPIVLARGTFSAGALVALARTAANGKYREERIGDRSVYVFTAKNEVGRNQSQIGGKPSVLLPGAGLVVSYDFMKMMTNELAVTVLDNNTLAVGSLSRIRQMLGTGARVGGDVLAAVNRKPNALLNFGLKMPAGFSQFINLGNDEISKNLDAVRFVSGAADVSDGSATISLAAKTVTPEQAQSLHEQLEAFQMLGKSFLGGAKGADKQVYARLVNDLKIARAGGEVTLDAQIAQSDINVLLDLLNRKKVAPVSSK